MDFVADESVDGHIIRALASAGHVVQDIHRSNLGSPDEKVLYIAHSRSTILITEDKDFGELVFAKESPHSGILLIRLDGFAPPDKVARVMMALGQHLHELQGSFTVIDKNKVRVRRQS